MVQKKKKKLSDLGREKWRRETVSTQSTTLPKRCQRDMVGLVIVFAQYLESPSNICQE